MKTLMISAAVLGLSAATASAQVAGVQGQVNKPAIGAPTPQVQVPGMPKGAAAAQPAPAATQADIPGIANSTAQPQTPAAITDGKTLNPGQASVNSSARVGNDSFAFAAGMGIQGMDGQALGRVIGVAKDRAGRVTSLTIQTADGVKRTMAPDGLMVRGNIAMTTQSEADLVSLPLAR